MEVQTHVFNIGTQLGMVCDDDEGLRQSLPTVLSRCTLGLSLNGPQAFRKLIKSAKKSKKGEIRQTNFYY